MQRCESRIEPRVVPIFAVMRIVYGKIVKRVGVSRFHPYETSLVFSERPDLTVLQIKPLQ